MFVPAKSAEKERHIQLSKSMLQGIKNIGRTGRIKKDPISPGQI
jgi:hypothetical protein